MLSTPDLHHPRGMAYRCRAWDTLRALRDYRQSNPPPVDDTDVVETGYRDVCRAIAALTPPLKPIVALKPPEPPPGPERQKGIA